MYDAKISINNWTGVTFWYTIIFQYTLLYCAIHGVYKNLASVFICTCGVVEYRAGENVTPKPVGTEPVVEYGHLSAHSKRSS